jgi:GT2 family glycosyltransferase
MSAITGAAQPSRVTVLIVNWNAWHYLVPCLVSIQASSFSDLEIVVIDNASVDGSADKLEKTFPHVQLIRNCENVGHTRAVNQGFRAARGELVLVLDADTESSPEAIGLMVRYLDEHPDICLVAPRTYNSDGTVQETARNFPSAINGLFGRQSLFTRTFPGNPFSRRYLQRESLSDTSPFRVESVASSCMLLRKSLVDRFGEWDEGYPGYFVDTDRCYRLKRAGVKVFCVPAARVVHHEMNSRTRKRNPRRIWMFHQGALRFYRKNRTLGWLDPRTVLAFAALSLRAGLLIVLNSFKANRPAEMLPAERRANDSHACEEKR